MDLMKQEVLLDLSPEEQRLVQQSMFEELANLARAQNAALKVAAEENQILRGKLSWYERVRSANNDEASLVARLVIWTLVAFGWPCALVLYLERYAFDAGAVPYAIGTLFWMAGIGVFANEWVKKGGRKK